ncbi:hypothetical protein VDG1235_3659 [Verrucomicrobiia bacterium DG1235]|nr:hypothetical protein VDG1235_3659 [Verrucomicrobiae bacterium DG1235]
MGRETCKVALFVYRRWARDEGGDEKALRLWELQGLMF